MYSEEARREAVDLWFALYPSISMDDFVAELGYPSRTTLSNWVGEDPRHDPDRATHRSRPILTRLEAIRRVAEGSSIGRAASECGVDRTMVNRDVDAFAEGGTAALLPAPLRRKMGARGKGAARAAQEPPFMRAAPQAPDALPDDPEALKAMVEELRMDNAILREVLDVLKADPGCAAARPTARERSEVAARLAGRFPATALCGRLGLARSTYYDRLKRPGRPDPADAIADDVERIFREDGRSARGYRFVHARLVEESGRVSEKVVLRSMRRRGLRVAYAKAGARYSSYAGEGAGAAPNLVLNEDGTHDFSAQAPNEKWLTDVTMFSLPDGGRAYLSAVIDCFDGRPVGWTVPQSPDAEMANSSLLKACARLAPGEAPLLHSDRGVHYQWDGWRSICDERGMERSMSRKGRSPDNARMEGFFGCMKNEMFHGRDWRGVGFQAFSSIADAWLTWFCEGRLKQFVDGDGRKYYDTIDNRRSRLGFAA